jgi:hypothetical protein
MKQSALHAGVLITACSLAACTQFRSPVAESTSPTPSPNPKTYVPLGVSPALQGLSTVWFIETQQNKLYNCSLNGSANDLKIGCMTGPIP